MDDLPDWNEYARVQQALLKTDRVNSHSWGLEAGLNHQLTKRDADVQLAIRSASRKERHHALLRRQHIGPQPTSFVDPVNAIDANRRLRLVRVQVNRAQWILLCAIGQSYTYAEIAARTGGSPNALRASVLRLRRRLTSPINNPLPVAS